MVSTISRSSKVSGSSTVYFSLNCNMGRFTKGSFQKVSAKNIWNFPYLGGEALNFLRYWVDNTDSENRVLILSVTVLCGMEF